MQRVPFNGEPTTNDYIRGRISGFITVLTGMPDMTYGYAWREWEKKPDYLTKYVATEEQHEAIMECIKKYYPKACIGVRIVES